MHKAGARPNVATGNGVKGMMSWQESRTPTAARNGLRGFDQTVELRYDPTILVDRACERPEVLVPGKLRGGKIVGHVLVLDRDLSGQSISPWR